MGHAGSKSRLAAGSKIKAVKNALLARKCLTAEPEDRTFRDSFTVSSRVPSSNQTPQEHYSYHLQHINTQQYIKVHSKCSSCKVRLRVSELKQEDWKNFVFYCVRYNGTYYDSATNWGRVLYEFWTQPLGADGAYCVRASGKNEKNLKLIQTHQQDLRQVGQELPLDDGRYFFFVNDSCFENTKYRGRYVAYDGKKLFLKKCENTDDADVQFQQRKPDRMDHVT